MASTGNIQDEIHRHTLRKSEKTLRQAVLDKNLPKVKYLISLGVNVNSKNMHGYTALHLSSSRNVGNSHYSIIKELLVNGADVNAQNKLQQTPLHFLVTNADIGTIRLFLNFKPNVNSKDNEGLIPLYYALSEKKLEVAQLLLDHGSDVNNVSRFGLSIMHWACCWGTKKAMKLLFKNGADVNILDQNRCIPLMRMLLHRDNESLIHYVLKYSDVNALDVIGKNVLFFAGKADAKKILLRHVAKMRALGLWVHPSLLPLRQFRAYFAKCEEELGTAKEKKIDKCWVTFFNLLMDNKRKLKNYAGNRDLVEGFERSGYLRKFPIYGPEMKKNLSEGIKRRKAFDKSCEMLSDILRVFNPDHLVVRNVLDSLSNSDVRKFVS